MFCSNCGKTVYPPQNPEEKWVCPHCHMELGDVCFPGMPYTSVQFRIVPGTPMPIDKAYAYTRTNYSVNIEDGEAPEPMVEDVDGDDVESATTYRPVLQREEDEPVEEYAETEEESGAAEEGAPSVDEEFKPEELTEEQIQQALNNLKGKGLDADTLTETYEYQATDVADDSRNQRIEQYESDARAEQERRAQKNSRGKLRIPFMGKKSAAYDGVDDADEAYDVPVDYTAESYDGPEPVYEEVPAEEAAEAPVDGEYAEHYAEQPADEATENYAESYDEYGYEEEGYEEAPAASVTGWLNATVAGIRVANILKVVGALVVVVICFALGMKWFGYVSDAQQKSPIDGVSLSLYNSGIEAITANASDEKTNELLSTYNASGVVAFTAQQQQYVDSLTALMPEEPQVNDQLFLDALTQIQDNIANAVIADAMSGDSTSEASLQNWATINDAIESLKTATDAVHLQAIVSQEVVVVTTTPTPEPTPVSYTTLARGDEGDAVKELQQRLFDLGYLADAPDGQYGNKTTTAIKYFQMGHELTVSGIADSATQALLYSDEAMNQADAKAAYQARQAEQEAADGE